MESSRATQKISKNKTRKREPLFACMRRHRRRLRTTSPPALRLNVYDLSELRSLIQRYLPSNSISQLRICGVPQPAGCRGRLLRYVRIRVVFRSIAANSIDDIILLFCSSHRHGRYFEGSRLSIQVRPSLKVSLLYY